MDNLASHSLRSAVEELVYESCIVLDERRFNDYLALGTADFRYRITAYSPEIRKEMTWLEHDREGLAALFELLPRHHVDHAEWQRHAVLYRARQEGDLVHAVTSLVVHHTLRDVGDTHLEGGTTKVFVAGKYLDTLRLERGELRLAARTVRLETRQLGIGTHLIV